MTPRERAEQIIRLITSLDADHPYYARAVAHVESSIREAVQEALISRDLSVYGVAWLNAGESIDPAKIYKSVEELFKDAKAEAYNEAERIAALKCQEHCDNATAQLQAILIEKENLIAQLEHSNTLLRDGAKEAYKKGLDEAAKRVRDIALSQEFPDQPVLIEIVNTLRAKAKELK
jgi:hypothetical protein